MAKSKRVQTQRVLFELQLPADAEIVEAAELYRRWMLQLPREEHQELAIRAMPVADLLKTMLRLTVAGGHDLSINTLRARCAVATAKAS